MLAIASAWAGCTVLSRFTDFSGTGYAAFALPIGVAVAIAMRWPHLWRHIILGVVFSNVIMALVVSRPLLSPIIAGLVNGGEAALIGLLLRKWGTSRIVEARDAIGLALAAIGGAALAGGVATLALAGYEGRNLAEMWWSWLSADVLGVMLVVPLFNGTPLPRPRIRPMVFLSCAVISAAALGRIAVLFDAGLLDSSNVFITVLPWYALLLLPVLAGVEYGAIGVAAVQLPAALAVFASQAVQQLDAWLQRVALTTLLSVSLLAAVLAIRQQVARRETADSIVETLFELSPEATAQMLLADTEDGPAVLITAANRAMRDLLGLPHAIAPGTRFDALLHPDDVGRVHRVLENGSGDAIEVRLGERLCSLSARLAHASVASGSVVIAVLRDVTELRQTVDRLASQARIDPLTGLLNRRTFDEEIATAFHSERRQHLGLLFVDVDRLKSINDEYGHAAGDTALKETAARISQYLREGDMAARFGGDEFVVAINVPDAGALEIVRHRLAELLAAPISVGGVSMRLSSSVGAAIASDEPSIEDLLRRADHAMYTHKLSRRGAETPGS